MTRWYPAMAFASFGVAHAQDDAPAQPRGRRRPAAAIPESVRHGDPARCLGWRDAATVKAIHSRSWTKAAAQILVFGGNGRHVAARHLRSLARRPAITPAPGIAGLALRRHSGSGSHHACRLVPMSAFGPSTDAGRVSSVDYDAASRPSTRSLLACQTTDAPNVLHRLRRTTIRITHGCVNVSPRLLCADPAPDVRAGRLFYILPDTAPIADTCPRVRAKSRGCRNLTMGRAVHGPSHQ